MQFGVDFMRESIYLQLLTNTLIFMKFGVDFMRESFSYNFSQIQTSTFFSLCEVAPSFSKYGLLN